MNVVGCVWKKKTIFYATFLNTLVKAFDMTEIVKVMFKKTSRYTYIKKQGNQDKKNTL